MSRTDGLVEHVEVATIQQKALSSDQGLTSNLEGRRLGRIAGVRRTGVFLKHHQDFFLGDVTAVSGTDGLVGNTLTLTFPCNGLAAYSLITYCIAMATLARS